MGRSVRDDFLYRLASLLRCHIQRFASAWPLLPLDTKGARPMILDQHQSPLFGRISAELRLLIYNYVLADEDRFLHIYRDLGGRKRLAHRRCRDCTSELPTWQHSCFGEWSDEKDDAYRITVTVTEDMILYIFLSCRRIYAEALEILYAKNAFHFKRATDMLAFYKTMPSVQWHTIRRIHFSTVFQADKLDPNRLRMSPPEIMNDWKECCQLLKRSPNLRDIRLDIIVRTSSYDMGRPQRSQDNRVFDVLLPLKDVKAEIFEIEIDDAVPETVMALLGPVNFKMSVRQRPYNHFVFHI